MIDKRLATKAFPNQPALGKRLLMWLRKDEPEWYEVIGVRPTDAPTFALVPLVFLLIAGFACWLPARRAAGMSPLAALREE